jgi:hypothetical protein
LKGFKVERDLIGRTKLFGLRSLSDILETKKNNISETGSISILRLGVGRIPDDGQSPKTL